MIRELDGAELVTRARIIAGQSGRGVRRRGALCAAVVLAEASTIAKARLMLSHAPIPGEVRHAALGVINQVLTEATEGSVTDAAR